MKDDLHKLRALYVDFEESRPSYRDLSDRQVTAQNAIVECHFRNLESIIVEKISQADAVVGCVAWLTSEPALRALAAKKYGVSIIVQKEDFLRPDLGDSSGFASRMRRLYDALPQIDGPTMDAGWLEQRGGAIGAAKDVNISIRCVGHRRDPVEITLPRMHHKFLVFCKYAPKAERFWPYIPYAVRTGSFNMTRNGLQSLENAVYIQHAEVAERYFDEWDQLLMISEALDWITPYAAPDIQFNDGAMYS